MSIQRIVLKESSLIVPKEWPITANFARWKGKEDICRIQRFKRSEDLYKSVFFILVKV